jgi:DNA-binding transcriptional ArsR family regulator
MPDAENLARIFKVLSVEARVRIVELLKGQALCVGALAHRLGVTPAAVSQHLRVMRDAGIVSPDKQGNHVHYRLSEETLARWKGLAGGFLETKGESKGGKSCAMKKRRRDAKNRRS